MSDQAQKLGSRAVFNSSVVLGARVISRLVALVVVVKLANYLQPDRYGQYTTLIAYSALVSVVADLGLSPLYTREAAREPSRLSEFLATLLSGKVALAVAASVILAAALYLAGLGGLILPGCALLVLTSYATLLRNTFYARGRLEFEAVAILAEIAIQAAAIFVGARLGAGVGFFVWGYAASFGFTCLYCLVVIPLFRLGRAQLGFQPGLFRGWLKVAFPFAVGALLTNLYFRADVPILDHFKGTTEVGWYQFAYKPFEALQFIPLAIQAVVYPLLGVYYREGGPRLVLTYERFFKVLVVLGWPLTVGTFVLAQPVGRLFRLYPESVPALRILALAIVFLFANSAFTAMLYAIDRQNLFAWTTGIAVVVNIGLNLILIPIYGYLAAATTTVITEAAFSVVGLAFIARRGHHLPWLRLTWRTLAAGLVMGVALFPAASSSILLAAPYGLLVYAAGLFVLKAVDREEVDLLLRGLRTRG